MNELENTANTRRALRWLSQQLAWEQALVDLRNDQAVADADVDLPARAA